MNSVAVRSCCERSTSEGRPVADFSLTVSGLTRFHLLPVPALQLLALGLGRFASSTRVCVSALVAPNTSCIFLGRHEHKLLQGFSFGLVVSAGPKRGAGEPTGGILYRTEPTVQDCTLSFSVNGRKDVSGCPVAPEECSCTVFLALFLFAALIVCVCVCVCVWGGQEGVLPLCTPALCCTLPNFNRPKDVEGCSAAPEFSPTVFLVFSLLFSRFPTRVRVCFPL